MKEPYGLVLESLGKPSSSPAFMMPRKTADTDPNTSADVSLSSSGPSYGCAIAAGSRAPRTPRPASVAVLVAAFAVLRRRRSRER